MLLGTYEILHDHEIDERMTISSDIKIEDGKSKIEISKEGIVRAYAESIERLHTMKYIAEIAINSASNWGDFNLKKIKITNLETGEILPEKFFGDVSISTLTINPKTCEDAIKSLISSDSEALWFLSRATNLLRHTELSAFLSLIALELELNKAIPTEKLSSRGKVEVLKFLKVPYGWTRDLDNLISLRNRFAHGTWKGKKFENTLLSLLSGNRDDWLTGPGKIRQIAVCKILEKIINIMEFLANWKKSTIDQI